MSYFIGVAIPQTLSAHVPKAFDARCHITEVTLSPFGESTIGTRRYPYNFAWSALLIQVGSSSASLICQGVQRKTHNNDHTDIMSRGIQALLALEDCPYVLFLAHFFRGNLHSEEVEVKREEIVEYSAILPNLFYEVEPNVRYVFCRQDTQEL